MTRLALTRLYFGSLDSPTPVRRRERHLKSIVALRHDEGGPPDNASSCYVFFLQRCSRARPVCN